MVSEKARADFEHRIALSRDHADDIDKTSGRRTSAPVRLVFACNRTQQKADTPLAKLVNTGGRGADVALKLYLALIWRSSAEPFTTTLPARKWAELLALPEPDTNGARRVADAIKALRDNHQLIAVDNRPGEPSQITLLHESGSGQPYTRPRGRTAPELYLNVPAAMWTSGHIQRLTGPGVAMLLAVLSEQSKPGDPVWWSTTRWAERISLASATRARGTRELKDAGLLTVKKRPITVNGKGFAAEQVRSIYAVTGAAKLPTQPDRAKTPKANSPNKRIRETKAARTST
jgi:hypothetical protein